jgi:hypothetical protein
MIQILGVLEGEAIKFCRWTVNGNFNMVEIPSNKSSRCWNMLLGNEGMGKTCLLQWYIPMEGYIPHYVIHLYKVYIPIIQNIKSNKHVIHGEDVRLNHHSIFVGVKLCNPLPKKSY